MTTLPLRFTNDHLFIEVDGVLWLLDTGAPTSFGGGPCRLLGREEVEMPAGYMGLTADSLFGFVGVECRGLLGADVLNRFDHVFDVAGGESVISDAELDPIGPVLPITGFMGIPILTATIAGSERRMFFDTGAQVSYLQDDALLDFPEAGVMADFFPGVGNFETATHSVPATLAGVPFTLRCGSLPGLLGMTLMMADVEGIIGNEVMRNRKIGFYPRRGLLSL